MLPRRPEAIIRRVAGLFMKGESGRSPGEGHGAIPWAVHASNSVGLALMATGGMLLIGAGIF